METLVKKEKQKLCLVYYEKWMFERMYKKLRDKKSRNFPREFQNAILESFLLHTRNLIDFFQGTDKNPPYKKHCADIVISDFRDKNGNDLEIVKEWEIAKDDKQKINTRLSHLSEKRLEIEKKWVREIEKFYGAIKREFDKFVENVSKEYFNLQCGIVEKEDFRVRFDKKSDKELENKEEDDSISDTSSNVVGTF